jgi:hypothetical protein
MSLISKPEPLARAPRTFGGRDKFNLVDELPEELMVKVLSFIPSRALLSNVALVSKKMSRLVNDALLWTHVEFKFKDSPEYVSAVLARYKNSIRSVTLKSHGHELNSKISLLVDSEIFFEQIQLETEGFNRRIQIRLDDPIREISDLGRPRSDVG